MEKYLAKAMRILSTCETLDQLEGAEKYAALFLERVSKTNFFSYPIYYHLLRNQYYLTLDEIENK